MNIHCEVKDLSRNLGEKHSPCWNFKSLFHILLPFSLRLEPQVRYCLRQPYNLHLPLCQRPEDSGGERGGQGNLRSLFLQPFAKLALLGNGALMPGV